MLRSQPAPSDQITHSSRSKTCDSGSARGQGDPLWQSCRSRGHSNTPKSQQGAGLGANTSDQHHEGFKDSSKNVSFFFWHSWEEALESSQGSGNITSPSSVKKPFMGDVKSVTEMTMRENDEVVGNEGRARGRHSLQVPLGF